jgi:hypothetical protein
MFNAPPKHFAHDAIKEAGWSSKIISRVLPAPKKPIARAAELTKKMRKNVRLKQLEPSFKSPAAKPKEFKDASNSLFAM